SIDLTVAPAMDARRPCIPVLLGQDLAVAAAGDVIGNHTGVPGTDPDIDEAVVGGRQGARVLLFGVQPAKVFAATRRRIETDEAGGRVGAAIEASVRPYRHLPDVLFALARPADIFEHATSWVEAEKVSVRQRPHIDVAIGTERQPPGAGFARNRTGEDLRLAGDRVDSDDVQAVSGIDVSLVEALAAWLRSRADDLRQ